MSIYASINVRDTRSLTVAVLYRYTKFMQAPTLEKIIGDYLRF